MNMKNILLLISMVMTSVISAEGPILGQDKYKVFLIDEERGIQFTKEDSKQILTAEADLRVLGTAGIVGLAMGTAFGVWMGAGERTAKSAVGKTVGGAIAGVVCGTGIGYALIDFDNLLNHFELLKEEEIKKNSKN